MPETPVRPGGAGRRTPPCRGRKSQWKRGDGKGVRQLTVL